MPFSPPRVTDARGISFKYFSCILHFAFCILHFHLPLCHYAEKYCAQYKKILQSAQRCAIIDLTIYTFPPVGRNCFHQLV